MEKWLRIKKFYIFKDFEKAGADYCEIIMKDGPCPSNIEVKRQRVDNVG